jgi:hypothetical protein|tara:strand:- start:614 stop:916 length:303 start_codon:yes stop_codon:yes gene_type:complete
MADNLIKSIDEFEQEYRNGPQRVCWLCQMVTDWMGDDGTLKKMQASVRHPNIVGDTNTVTGEVTKKYTEGDEHLGPHWARQWWRCPREVRSEDRGSGDPF